MAFERRFNAIRFYSKLNHFVLSPRKKAEPFRFKNSSEWFCGLYEKRKRNMAGENKFKVFVILVL